MGGQTVPARVDEALLQRFKEIAIKENRPTSHIVAVAVKSFLAMSPSARRVAFSLDESCSAEEQEFAAKVVNRSMLRIYQTILESRQINAIRERPPRAGTRDRLLEAKDIETEPVCACST